MQPGLSDTVMTALLQGLGVSISNLSIHCDSTAYGHFSGTSELAITDGIVMSTGHVVDLADSNYSTATSTDVLTSGDLDLDTLLGAMTYNACVMEFDCVPTGDTLEFNFAFGSEEYPEFVFAAFNDVFAILLSGPGISGNQNVASIPGTSIPVAINNLNASTNSTFYYDNENPHGQYISLDGFSLNLTAFSVVVPFSTYHFKIAIADAGDAIYDSGVFLEAFSFRSNGDLNAGAENLRSSLSLFPNPADDHITIRAYSPLGEIRIRNLTGSIVKKYSCSENFLQLNIGSMEAGIYFIESLSSNTKSVGKLIVR